tara:strand:+ start:316 stop:648 length:333 start_codon:yes stop_codon:yes gene_type:complete
LFRLLFWLFFAVLGLAVVAFTVSNRGMILIDLWPVPISFEAPIFAVVLGAIFIGFLIGGFVSSISASKRIFLNRHLSKALENAQRKELFLKKELKKFEANSPDPPARSNI